MGKVKELLNDSEIPCAVCGEPAVANVCQACGGATHWHGRVHIDGKLQPVCAEHAPKAGTANA